MHDGHRPAGGVLSIEALRRSIGEERRTATRWPGTPEVGPWEGTADVVSRGLVVSPPVWAPVSRLGHLRPNSAFQAAEEREGLGCPGKSLSAKTS